MMTDATSINVKVSPNRLYRTFTVNGALANSEFLSDLKREDQLRDHMDEATAKFVRALFDHPGVQSIRIEPCNSVSIGPEWVTLSLPMAFRQIEIDDWVKACIVQRLSKPDEDYTKPDVPTRIYVGKPESRSCPLPQRMAFSFTGIISNNGYISVSRQEWGDSWFRNKLMDNPRLYNLFERLFRVVTQIDQVTIVYTDVEITLHKGSDWTHPNNLRDSVLEILLDHLGWKNVPEDVLDARYTLPQED